MDRKRLLDLLEEVRQGTRSPDSALEALASLPFQESPGLSLDTHRELRCGFPEAVYAPGKSVAQVVEAARGLAARHDRILVTRVETEQAKALCAALPEARWEEDAHCVWWRARPAPAPRGNVAVVTAGASDRPVAAEAICTLRLLDLGVEGISDVGVAGLHRLLDRLESLRHADVLVVCAGMEGALASVLGGLVAAPVIAVPTSVGYGASFGGLAALLTMLNSCAPGIAVVNVDNGFGAGLLAGRILRAGLEKGAD